MAEPVSPQPILVHYKSPPGPAVIANIHNPLFSLAYHTTMKCVVCVDCQMVILAANLPGHMTTNPKHKPKDGSRVSAPKIQADLREYLGNLDLNYDLVQRPNPGTVVPAYFWLEMPQDGYICTICEDYAAVKKDTLRNHIQGKAGPEDGGCRAAIHRTDLNWSDLINPCSVQRFSNNGSGEFKSYFRVYPNVSANTSTRFTDFLSELPDSLKSGASLYRSHSGSIQTIEFDLPPFLAKTKWTEIVEGFSVGKMAASVSLRSKGDDSDQLFHRLRPMGKRLLSSISSTINVPHVILDGLTAYKTKR
jgi:orsellinic acid/F9775 biosynthesis protein OrsD